MRPLNWITPLLFVALASPAIARPGVETSAPEAPKICKPARIWGSPDKPRRLCLTRAQWDDIIVSEPDMPAYRAGLRNSRDSNPMASTIALPAR